VEDPSVAEPLVHAVGAVDSLGVPLRIGRLHALPRLAAYGNHAVALDGNQYTPAYSGSSVATVVVSAAAAAVWRHRGDLSRYQLMDDIYSSGDPLYDPLDNNEPLLALLGPPVTVQRISLCRALHQVCDGGSCQDLGTLECLPWQKERPQQAVDPPEESLDLDASQITNYREPPFEKCPDWLQYLDKDGLPEEICFPGAPYGIDEEAWTGPQPEDIPCPSCPVKSETGEGEKIIGCEGTCPYTLYFSIHEGYQGGEITQLTVEIGTNAYLVDFTSLLGGPLAEGQLIKIRGIPGTGIENGVALSFLSTQHGAGMNPVVVLE
jgi:hypothetical protein